MYIMYVGVTMIPALISIHLNVLHTVGFKQCIYLITAGISMYLSLSLFFPSAFGFMFYIFYWSHLVNSFNSFVMLKAEPHHIWLTHFSWITAHTCVQILSL